jgi:hypothetical protein
MRLAEKCDTAKENGRNRDFSRFYERASSIPFFFIFYLFLYEAVARHRRVF